MLTGEARRPTSLPVFKPQDLLDIAMPPATPDSGWLQGAPSAVDHLKTQRSADQIILFSNAGQALLHSILVPNGSSTPTDGKSMQHATIDPYGRWALEHVSGGGEPDSMYLSPPIDSFGCKALEGAEQLIFRRQFAGVDKGTSRTELSQQLVQALDLYFMEEEGGYCRLNGDGDIEPIIRVRDLSSVTGRAGSTMVTIEAEQLHRYMAVTETTLVMKFDFTRYPSKSFWGGFRNQTHGEVSNDDLFYHTGVQADASYANGVMFIRPLLTKEMLIAKASRAWSGKDRRYATFKAHDWKNDCSAEISCAPDSLASYFDEGSPLPFQTTPAFFKPDVLLKYKADPVKYRLEHRSIHARGGWQLKSYDVNEAGQVHVYLCDLATLPYDEQVYWLSFNEWPKGSISQRAFETDFEGSFSSQPDELSQLKYEVSKLDKLAPDYWQPRDHELAATVHYPITASIEEWSNAILALDQLVVEGFAVKALRARLAASGAAMDRQWASLKLLLEVLTSIGIDEDEAAGIMAPLRQLHHLRSKVKGHAAAGEKAQLVKEAKKDHGSLPAHFRSLVTSIQQSFDRLVEVL